MKLENNPVENFGGFELDASAIELRSAEKWKIMLPYHGPLPEKMSSTFSAYIQITAQPVQGVKCILVVDLINGKRMRRPLEITNEQVMDLLDKFFAVGSGRPATPQATGLAPRQLGNEECNYFNWRMLVTDFKWLGEMADRLTPQQRSWLHLHLEK